MIVLLMACAGAGGAVARFVIDSYVKSRSNTKCGIAMSFPWATVGINVSGSMLLGVLAGLVLFQGGSGDVQTVIGTGFCGGYTTFSTASFETVRLVQAGRHGRAFANALGTLVCSVAACAVGVGVAAAF